MPTNTIPPTRRRTRPMPPGHRSATSDAAVLDEVARQINLAEAVRRKRKNKKGKSTENKRAAVAAIRRLQDPLPRLTDTQRQAIKQYSSWLGTKDLRKVNGIIRLGLKMRASPAAASPSRPSKRRLQEVGISARGTLKALKQLDAATQLRLLASSSDADVSGIERADVLRQVGILLDALAKGADKLAGTIHSTPGAPPLAAHIAVTVQLLAGVWAKTGRSTLQRNRKYPQQNIGQSDKTGSFEQWLQDLLVVGLGFATASEIHTAVGQVAGDATTTLDRQQAEGGGH